MRKIGYLANYVKLNRKAWFFPHNESRELGQEYTNGGRRDQGEGYMRHYRCFCNLFSPRGKEPQRSLDCVLASHVMQIMLETQPLISFPGCPTCVSMIYYMIYSCYEKDRFR